jgi:predicted alpha-1,6-mannanase (GH76 family)
MKATRFTVWVSALAFLGASGALGALSGPLGDDTAPLERAARAMERLASDYHWKPCRWYEPWTWNQLCQAGTWEPAPARGWWNSANALTATIDYTRLSGDPSFVPLIENAFSTRRDGDYTERDYNDDEAWWALAWIDAYDLFVPVERHEADRFLRRAEFIFRNMARSWDDVCGGGIWWKKKPKTYKNAVANELFLSVAAKLYVRTLEPRYLEWADRELHWFLDRSAMLRSDGLIVDGLDTTCAVTASTSATWTYNQGVILGALVELGALQALGHPEYAGLVAVARRIALAVISSPVLAPRGVLVEFGDESCGGDDCPQFKGVFMRNLGALECALVDPSTQADRAAISAFIGKTADSIWLHDRVSGESPVFGRRWEGPANGDINFITQSSALDSLVAAFAR